MIYYFLGAVILYLAYKVKIYYSKRRYFSKNQYKILQLQTQWKIISLKNPDQYDARSQGKLINLKDEIIFWGGFSDKSFYSRENKYGEIYKFKFEELEIITPKVTGINQKDLPNPRVYHSLVYWEKKQSIIMIGGCKIDKYNLLQDRQAEIDIIYIFDILKNKWRLQKTQGPFPISFLGGQNSLIMDEQLYVFCADEQSEQQMSIQCLDLRSFKWVTVKAVNKSPMIRCFFSSYQIDEENFIIFGGSSFRGYCLNDLWKYNIKSNEWHNRLETKYEFRPEPRQCFGFVQYNQYLIIVGGLDLFKKKSFNDVWALNMLTFEWYLIQSLSQDMIGIHNHCIAIVDNMILIFGGLTFYDNFQVWNHNIYFLEIQDICGENRKHLNNQQMLLNLDASDEYDSEFKFQHDQQEIIYQECKITEEMQKILESALYFIRQDPSQFLQLPGFQIRKTDQIVQSNSNVSTNQLNLINLKDLKIDYVNKGFYLEGKIMITPYITQSIQFILIDQQNQFQRIAVYNYDIKKYEWKGTFKPGCKVIIKNPYFKTAQDYMPLIRIDDPKNIQIFPQENQNLQQHFDTLKNLAIQFQRNRNFDIAGGLYDECLKFSANDQFLICRKNECQKNKQQTPQFIPQEIKISNEQIQQFIKEQFNTHQKSKDSIFTNYYQQVPNDMSDLIDQNQIKEIQSMGISIFLQYTKACSTQQKIQSIELFKDILKKQKNLACIHYNIGELYFEEQNYNQTIIYLKDFIRIHEMKKFVASKIYMFAFYLIGCSYDHLNNYKEAYPYLIKAVDLDQNDATFNGALGYHFFAQKEYKQSQEYYKKVINLQTKDQNVIVEILRAYLNLSIIELIQKNFENLIMYYEKIIDYEPMHLQFLVGKLQQIIFGDESIISFQDKLDLLVEVNKSYTFSEISDMLALDLAINENNISKKHIAFNYYCKLVSQKSSNIYESQQLENVEQLMLKTTEDMSVIYNNSEQQNIQDKKEFEQQQILIEDQDQGQNCINKDLNEQKEILIQRILENIVPEDEDEIIDKAITNEQIKTKRIKQMNKFKTLKESSQNFINQRQKYKDFQAEFEYKNQNYVVTFENKLKLDQKLQNKFVLASSKGFVNQNMNKTGIKRFKINNNFQFEIKISQSDYRLWCPKEIILNQVHVLNFNELIRHKEVKRKFQQN